MSLRTLKRAKAVWNLTEIPDDTPLETTLTINVELINCPTRLMTGQENPTVMISPTTKFQCQSMRMTVDSLGQVREIKHRVEPLAYNIYISALETGLTLQQSRQFRNTRYYAHVKSPSIESPTSDYGSEEGDDIGERDGNQEGRVTGRSDQFLKACKLVFDGIVMDETEPLYKYRVPQGSVLSCQVDVSKLIYH